MVVLNQILEINFLNHMIILFYQDIIIKQKFSFKNSAKDAFITTQLKTAMIFNKDIKVTNYNIDTINSKTYIFGIAMTPDEKRKVIEEAKGIYGVKEVVPSIILVEDLSRNKN